MLRRQGALGNKALENFLSRRIVGPIAQALKAHVRKR